MISVDEKYDVRPICPHCKTDLNQIYTQPLAGFLGRRYIYFCPQCRGVLGVSHRKGFWMG